MRRLAGLWLLWVAAGHGPPAQTLYRDRTVIERNLQARNWQAIRIHVEPMQLDTYLAEEVLPAATRWLTSVVEVLPVVGNLKLQQDCELINTATKRCVRVRSNYRDCGDVQIPVAHFADKEYCSQSLMGGCETSPGGAGIPNADLAIYATSRNTQWCSGGTVAYAQACIQADDDRPVAGSINFCPQRVGQNWQRDVAVAIHEILHAMAFSSSLFPWFRDAEGRPRTPRDRLSGFPPLEGGVWVASSNTIREATVDGQKRHFVVLPKVLQVARSHFGCEALTGIPLEEQGGDGTAFSHWDARIMHTEIMAAESSTVPRVSDLTLALLEDSGWYKVHLAMTEGDDSAAGPFFFGKGQGCSFVEGSCVVDQRSAFPETFCIENQGDCSASWSGTRTCSEDHMSVGLCNNCRHPQPLPEAYRHFENPRLGGFARYVGYCPTVEPLWFCKERSAYHQDDSQRIGESLGASSRCILSTAIEQGWNGPPQPRGTCRNVYCEEGGLQIQIGEQFVQCLSTDTGQQKQVGGRYAGYLVCPDYGKLCGPGGLHGPRQGGADCFFPGVMRHGRCVCPPGFLGTDCSVRDVQASRQDFPFGLRYPQQEFLLQVGVPLSQSSLDSWPVRPRLLSGPSLLTFRAEPDLPRGLRLEQGELEGLPLVPAPRRAYVIKASGFVGSTTTVIFITVACEGASCSYTAPPTTTASGSTTGAQASYEYGIGAPRGRLVLELKTAFEQLQVQPGLEAFVESLKAIFRQTFQVSLTNVAIAAGSGGNAVVEAAVPLQQQPALEEGLRQQLADSASPLRTSAIGSYVGDATVTSIGDRGSSQVWPLTSETSGWLDVKEWEDWFTAQPLPVKVALIASLSLTFMGCFLLCCRQVWCCKGKGGERAHLTDHVDLHAPSTPTGWSAPTPVVLGRTPTVAPGPSPDLDAAMEQMLGMGFNFDQSKASLEANGWDVARASTAILERMDSLRSFEMDVQVESATDSEAPRLGEVPARPNSA